MNTFEPKVYLTITLPVLTFQANGKGDDAGSHEKTELAFSFTIQDKCKL
jgi:hypothetical protein